MSSFTVDLLRGMPPDPGCMFRARFGAATDPRFLHARRCAARFAQPHLAKPTAERRGLTPRVQIGSLRDPAQPINIRPAFYLPEVHGPDRYDVIAALVVLGLVVGLYLAWVLP